MADISYAPTGGAGGSFRKLRWGRAFTINAWQRGVLLRAGEVVDTLDPGRRRHWSRHHSLAAVDLRPYVITLPTQEVPTADGLTIKVTAAAEVHVDDPVRHLTGTQAPSIALYVDLQVALREVVATMTVDELVTQRTEVATRLHAQLRVNEALGVVVDRVELRDIILPNDLKKAQAQVLLARAEGQAALERARGETAALRNLANAARLVNDNPALLQLRLIQQLQASTGHTVVIGAPASVAPIAGPTPTDAGEDDSG